MFEISEELILEQSDDIFGVSQISWESSPWKQLSLVNDEEVISLSHANVYVFSDSVLCLGEMNQNPTSNTVWVRQLGWFKDSSQYRALDTIDGEPLEFECNIFPGFSTLELVREVQKFMSKMGEPEQFQGRIIFMSLFNDIIWGYKDNETECIANSTLVSLLAKKFQQDVGGHSSDLGQRQSGIPLTKKDQEENGIESLNSMMDQIRRKADTQSSDPQVRSLNECSTRKEGGKLSYSLL